MRISDWSQTCALPILPLRKSGGSCDRDGQCNDQQRTRNRTLANAAVAARPRADPRLPAGLGGGSHPRMPRTRSAVGGVAARRPGAGGSASRPTRGRRASARGLCEGARRLDRTSVVSGKSVYVRVDLGGRWCIKKKKKKTN